MLLSIPSESANAILASLLLFGSYSMGAVQDERGHSPLANVESVRVGRGLAEKATKTPKAPAEVTTKAPKAPKGATLAPTSSPSSLPSFVPSETPCYEESEVTELVEILGEISDICLMLTEGTPQNLAYVYVRDNPYDLSLASSTSAEWHERFALSVFYYSVTNDPYGALSDWVPTSPATDECDWTDVHCINGFVSSLPVEWYNFEGTVPSELAGLSALSYLSVAGNLLSAPTYLGALGNLANLDYLDLGGVGLTQVPSEFGNLNILGYLYLAENALTSLPTELGNLNSVKSMDLRGNNLSTLPTEFGSLVTLTSLDLTGNSLTNLPTGMGQLSDMKFLYLRDNDPSFVVPSFICDLLTENGGNLQTLRCGNGPNYYNDLDCCTN